MNEEEKLKYRKAQGLKPVKKNIEFLRAKLISIEDLVNQNQKVVKELIGLLDKPEIIAHFRHLHKVEDVLEDLVAIERIIQSEKVSVKNLNEDIEWIEETFNLVDKYVESTPDFESLVDNTDLSKVVKEQFTYDEKAQHYRDIEKKYFELEL